LNSQPNCTGIPAGVDAYSLNFTVTNTQGPGFLKVYPQGGSVPLDVSTINYVGGQTIANAAIVPAGTNGGITVIAGVSGTDVIIDINGYFPLVYNAGNLFVAVTSNDGGAAILGQNNSAVAGSHGVGGFAAGAGVVHGVQGQVGESALTGSSGVHGISDSTAATYGVLGETSGTSFGAAGVRGDDAGAGSTSGVLGQTYSSDASAAGVQGFATHAAASGGQFSNSGAGTVFLSTQVAAVIYDVYGGFRIRGGSLDIVGGPKNFVAPHPEDPGLEIRYASVEAPTVDVYFRGTASLVNGSARIEVPDHFRFTAREGTYMTTLTPVGRAVALSVEEEGPDGIVVRGNGGGRFHYVVWAERAEIVGYEPVVKNVTFTLEALERAGGPLRLPESTRALLVRNGTLNPDGTYNLETARARGWTIPERPDRIAPRQP
jgi:hypothetical protein